MDVTLIKIETLCEQMPQLDEQAFTARYPGAFVVAIGFLDASELSPGSGVETPLVIESSLERSDGTSGRRLDFTAAFKFGQRMRHDIAADHPLVGCTFFLRPTAAETAVLIGRSATCAITVPDKSVSDEHCRIEVTSSAVVVIDLDSTNGTCINQERIATGEPVALANEDILSVGRYSFQLVSATSLHAYLLEITRDH
jgi:FHA domain